jgi:Stage II sporulation protein E (SpoIIE)
VTLGAFRSLRRESSDPADSLLAMHKVLLKLADAHATSSATIGHWNAPASTFRWVTAGDQSPIRVASDGQLKPLKGEPIPDLGTPDFPSQVTTNTIRLDKTERLLLLSDSLIDPDTGLGLPAIGRAIAKADDNAGPATLRAIEDALREAHPEHLEDDATIIVLAPSGTIGAAG